ncbi:glycoside hydrolase family 43 protein [Natronoflexus pectinivorans]|uniref:Alpha-N-arabinofuranosidase n=1 Tax=Natronoflexus pectinivorans TaxID=682526 RepID=A0A4R2GDC8_9BACT|nr:glycoside hydrolase family 43 protein [Natronoflexus pectinivorans]TCO06098.1 alpha-N-arabinofuranosidase [Natronoflexus pectinivorans]
MIFKKAKTFLSSLLIIIAFTMCTSPFETVEVNNPILPGFYPDPSVCKGPNGYYMVHSTFGYFPGIPIFYSPDLINWEQIGHVMHRPDQMKLDSLSLAGAGMFAPTIEYHDGTFYVACTEVYGRGNFVVTATNPAGPWSDPYFFPEVIGIDPSLFFHESGKTYMIYNSDAPDDQPLYEGHRTIRMFEIDIEKMQVVGDQSILVDGGVDISEQPVWIEGPHIYRVGDYYYLSAAEGGTSVNHRQVIFRSEDIWGPYIPWENNPILTQMHLDPNRPNPITSTGHADMIQDLKGNWWAVYLACRPYDGNHYNTGRETFMSKVEWTEDGWPVINPESEVIPFQFEFDAALKDKRVAKPLHGNFTVRDDFDQPSLGFKWVQIRTPKSSWFNLIPEKGVLNMSLLPASTIKHFNPSFLGRRQQHMVCKATTSLEFKPEGEGQHAGLAVLQNEHRYYYLAQSLKDNQPVISLYKSVPNAIEDEMVVLATQTLSDSLAEKLYLRIDSDVDVYRFFFSYDGDTWFQIGEEQDARFLSTETAGGFIGSMFGLYTKTTESSEGGISANYHWFEYTGNDDIFK